MADRSRPCSGETVLMAKLALRSVSLQLNGSSLLSDVTFSMGAELVTLLGSGAAGKTMLLEALSGERKTTGRISAHGRLVPEVPRRRVASPVKRLRGPEAGRLLDIFGLWEARTRSGHELSASQNAALAVAEACAARPGVLLIDCALDVLPPFLADRAMSELLRLSRLGCGILVATRRPDLASIAPRVLVLERGRMVADGAPHELAAGLEGEQVVVETLDPSGVRQLLDPFRITVESREGALRLTVPDGQVRAAGLLRDGYGTVRAVHYRPATLSDAWSRLRE